MNREQFLELLASEYAYWRDRPAGDETASDIQIGAMGAVSNVMAAVCGHLAPWHRSDKTAAPAEEKPPPPPRPQPVPVDSTRNYPREG